jgi:hypothetical protein
MNLKDSLNDLLKKFNTQSKPELDKKVKKSFRDIDVDGTLYRISTENIEVGATIEVITFDEEGNEVLVPVEDNIWTIEGISFRTEDSVIVEIMEEEQPSGEESTDNGDAPAESLFNEEDVVKVVGLLDDAITKIGDLESKIEGLEKTITDEIVEMKKFKTEFSLQPKNTGLPRLNKVKEAIDYRDIAKRFK